MEMAAASGMVAPLDASPSEQGMDVTPEGGKKNKSGGPRRKVGRWSEEETNTLILLTNQVSTSRHSAGLFSHHTIRYLMFSGLLHDQRFGFTYIAMTDVGACWK